MKYLTRVLIFSLLISFLLPEIPVKAQYGSGQEPLWLAASPNSSPGSAPQTQVREIDTHTLDITITFSGVWTEVQTGNGQSYTHLWLEDYSSYREPGQPALPGVTFNILVPQGAKVEVIQQKASSHSVNLPRQRLPSKIIPAQRQASKSEPPPPWTPPDPARYASLSLQPQRWFEVKDTFQMRDYTILPLWVNPVCYRPANGEIELLEKIELRLTWPELSKAALDAAVVSDSPSFDRLVSQIVINPAPHTSLDATRTGEGYLIITPDEFVDELTPFESMKISQGYSVDITLLSEIPRFDLISGSEENNILAIQNYIKSLDPPPVYLLLVGDTNFIPAPTGKITFLKTDLYYGTLGDETDYVPDIHIGRFPARELFDVRSIVNKIISYNNDGHKIWHNKASFIATCDDDYNLLVEGSHNYVIEEFTAPLGFLGDFPENEFPVGGDQLYCISNDANEVDIISRINDGRGLITYSGHGFSSAWYDGAITILDGDISTLIQNNIFSFVSSFACSTNNFGSTSDPVGFGETWMIQESKGAIGFIGSADNSYWDQDDALERKFFEAIFENPLNPISTRIALSAGLLHVEELFPPSYYPLSDDGEGQYYWETYNLLGDPSQQLWLLPRNLFYLPIIYK